MIHKILYTPALIAGLFLLNSCIDSEDELRTELLSEVDAGDGAQVSAGLTDFSKYVSVGNSITAGYMDAALYSAGQNHSYPNLLAAQMRLAGGGSFNQPAINSVNGYNTVVSNPGAGVILGRFVLDVTIPGPVPLEDGDISSILTPYTGSVNNFGIPGSRVVDMVAAAYGTPDMNGDNIPEGNPFYVRIASDPGTSTILGDAASADGSFVSIWIGQNDLLGWLLSGGTAEDVTDNAAAIQNPSSLTDVANFTGALNAVVGTMTANGTKDGVIANLFDATFTPFFRAIPYNAIPLDANTAAYLMAGPNGDDGFTAYNQGLDQMASFNLITQADADQRKVYYSAGANPILIEDDQLEDISVYDPRLEGKGQMRPIKQGELVLLTAKPVLNTQAEGQSATDLYGVTWPLPEKYTLAADELATHADRLSDFNAAISASAATNDLPMLDMYSVLLGIAAGGGIEVNGKMLLPDFSPNGVFSTDGLHPNPRGQAIVANAFIDVINAKYGSTLKKINVVNLPGVNLK